MDQQPLRIKTSHLIALPEKEDILLFSSVEEISPGTFIFGLVKILGRPDHKRKVLIQILQERLLAFKQEVDPSGNIPRRFEHLLKEVNDAIADHISASAKIPFTDFHAVIGVVHKKQLFASGTGSLLALFMHRTAKQRYVIYELNKQFQDEEVSWEKPFLTVLDGELHPGDVFYLGTRISSREMPLGELQDVLVTLPPSGALKRIQQHLHRSTPYSAICIQVLQTSTSHAPKKLNPFSSLEQLGQTKAQTAELLGEQTPDIGGWLQKGSHALLQQLSAPGSRGIKNVLFFVLRFLIKIFTQIISILVIAIKEFFSLLWAIAKAFHRLYRSQRTGERNVAKEASEKAEQVKNTLRKLPKTSKYLAGGILATSLVFIVALSIWNMQKTRDESEQTFTIVQEHIEESISAAEASLIYENEEQAWLAVNEALALFETLSPGSRDQEATYQALQDTINLLLQDIRGITAPDLTTLVSFADYTPLLATEISGTVYLIDAGNQLQRFDELNNALQFIELTSGSVGTIMHATGEGEDILFIDENKQLGRINLTENTANPIVSGASQLESTDQLFIYNDNLYILSAATEQLVKMRPQGTGYEAGTGWISSLDSDLSSATDLAIDGDIFILTKTSIKRFNSGRELTFELDLVDPPLSNPVSIWTTIGTDYLYLLEPEQERLIVFNKSGDLIAQYVDPAFASAIEMVIREEEKRLFVVTLTDILSFPAEHLLQ
jgi:hypothetical protein